MLPRFLITVKRSLVVLLAELFCFQILSFPILKAKGNILIALMPGTKLHTCRELKSLKCTSVLFLAE